MHKITIVGAGRVGESTAQLLATSELCREVVLLDVRDGAAKGAALDIQESSPLFGFDTKVYGGSDPEAMRDSGLVIMTAGLPRKPGTSRSDVLEANLKVARGVVDDMLRVAPDAMLLMVTNPVDVLTYQAWKDTGWDRKRVFGLSGVLDAARMAAFVALETGLSAKDITAMVLGGHGDAMVPLPRYTCVNGISLEHFLDAEAIERIVERTRKGGAEILALKQTSSANDSPAASIAEMVDAVVHDRNRVLPCVSILDGDYAQQDVAMGVPAVINARGIDRVVVLPLTDDEHEQFSRSAQAVRDDITRLT